MNADHAGDDDWIDQTIGIVEPGTRPSELAATLRVAARVAHDQENEQAALVASGFYARLEAKARARGVLAADERLDVPNVVPALPLAGIGAAMADDARRAGVAPAAHEPAARPAPPRPRVATPWHVAVLDWFGGGGHALGALAACALLIVVVGNLLRPHDAPLEGWRGEDTEVLMWSVRDPAAEAKRLVQELDRLHVRARSEDVEATRIVSFVLPADAGPSVRALLATHGVALPEKAGDRSVQVVVTGRAP